MKSHMMVKLKRVKCSDIRFIARRYRTEEAGYIGAFIAICCVMILRGILQRIS